MCVVCAHGLSQSKLLFKIDSTYTSHERVLTALTRTYSSKLNGKPQPENIYHKQKYVSVGDGGGGISVDGASNVTGNCNRCTYVKCCCCCTEMFALNIGSYMNDMPNYIDGFISNMNADSIINIVLYTAVCCVSDDFTGNMINQKKLQTERTHCTQIQYTNYNLKYTNVCPFLIIQLLISG